MRRLRDGFRLVRASARVARRTPALLLPVLLQTIALLMVLAVVLRYGVAADGSRAFTAQGLLVLAASLLATTSAGVYCGAVAVAMTADRLDAGAAGLRQGLVVANRHLPSLLGWSVASATVGTVLQLLEQHLGPPGRWVTRGAGVLFSLGTVLVVPVLVLEGLRPVPALRRSAALLRARLGETTGGETGLQAATLAALLAALVLVGCPVLAIDVVAAVVVIGLLVVAWLTTNSVLHAVSSTVLHRFATGVTWTASPATWRRCRAPAAPVRLRLPDLARRLGRHLSRETTKAGHAGPAVARRAARGRTPGPSGSRPWAWRRRSA